MMPCCEHIRIHRWTDHAGLTCVMCLRCLRQWIEVR